jgi:hypothetical protein
VIEHPIQLTTYLSDALIDLIAADQAPINAILERTHPQIVTLEYFRERRPLLEQLCRLRRILE